MRKRVCSLAPWQALGAQDESSRSPGFARRLEVPYVIGAQVRRSENGKPPGSRAADRTPGVEDRK